jgi:hypothetical protein
MLVVAEETAAPPNWYDNFIGITVGVGLSMDERRVARAVPTVLLSVF